VALVAAVVGADAQTDGVEEFLRRHWATPLPPQGPPPARFTPLEASLAPEACGTCHPAQYADWRTSLHARAMGPGVSGQLVEMLRSDPASALDCLRCHAPLAEQAPLLREGQGFRPNPAFQPDLLPQGLVCAGCHVRGHDRFGPPKRDGSLTSAVPREELPHRGATRTPAFAASEFCRGCHQFGPDGFALNGKLLEDTYNEWRASRFAREGVSCQSCHMPDRRHLWRGIHDPEMVRRGLDVRATLDAVPSRPSRTATVRLVVRNTGVGHAFPTYVTPRVVLRAELLEATGALVPGGRREHVIAREVTLDLSREVFDTRLRPGEAATLVARFPADRPGLRARLSVLVEPDAFYARFFQALLEQGAGRGTSEIRRALEAARGSAFTVFRREIPLS
jgi:hypothetical protein